MKTIGVILVFCIFMLAQGCSGGGNVRVKPDGIDHYVVVDFQGYFKDSHVVMYINGNREFDGVLSSIPVLGYTGKSIKVSVENMKVNLKVKMGTREFVREVDLEAGNYVGILFNAETKMFSYVQSKYQFQYD